jgi:pyruvate/2-oxoglutarate dehydrogenase complex dihydrolipoamide dehydrogenase (E3) component
MDIVETDLCVIGGGSGGLTVAAGAVQLGARVVLVEGGAMGGDCLSTGCVPSKALIAAAARAQAMRGAGRFGIRAAEPVIDHAAVSDHVQGVIAAIAPHDSQARFEALGVRVIRAWARFAGPAEVEAGGTRIRARRFVIATGSGPFVPPIPGLDTVPFLTNETLWSLRERPAHLVIIGGGPIGLEIAQAHARLGARVTVIEAAAALGREDPEAASVVLARLRAEGAEIVERTQAERVTASGDGAAIVVTAGGRDIAGSHLLVAVGRAPRLAGLGLAAAGIASGPKGITVDRGLRTTNRRVWAIGDAAGGLQFTHVAAWHAGLVLRAALFCLPVRADPRAIPRVTFTDPELARIGPTEAEARALHGDRIEVLRHGYADNDRAQAERETEGFAKILVLRGRPIGATIVGPAAGEAISLLALAISARLRIGALAGMVAPYPTLGEIVKRAAGAWYVPRLFGNRIVQRAVRFLLRF